MALALMAALVTVSLTACGEGDAGDGGADGDDAAGEPYRLGAVLSLTGTYSGLGGPERDALEMEVERINEDGGVHGRDIEVVIEDDATDSAQSVAATTRLIEQEGVIAVLGASGTGQTMAMRQEIQRAGIPQVSMAGGSVVTADFDPWVFQTPWTNAIVVPKALGYLRDQGVERIALISDSGGYGADGRETILAQAGSFGMEIVADETFNPEDTDMSAQLTKIKGEDPEAVLMWHAGKGAAIIANNMRDLQMDVPLVGSTGNARMEFIEGAGDAAEGFVFPAGRILMPSAYDEGSEAREVAEDFTARFEERYGERPDIFAGHAYDALHIVVEAMRRLDEGFTPEELRDEVEATDGLVAVGGTFTFSDTDHNGLDQDDLVMYRVEDGEWELAE